MPYRHRLRPDHGNRTGIQTNATLKKSALLSPGLLTKVDSPFLFRANFISREGAKPQSYLSLFGAGLVIRTHYDDALASILSALARTFLR